MTHEEILQALYDHTLIGNAPEVKDLVNQGLADGLGCESMLYDALIPSLEEVGARFERGDYFVPEMLIAARAMQGALDILRPLLAETGAKPIGTYVMGTVKGDVHDIGKNLVNIMLEGAGFTVYDLGVNVAPEKFVEMVQRASAGHRRLLGVPDDDDADVQGEHQRAPEGRHPRRRDRDGRRGTGDTGVRGRGRRGRLRVRRIDGGAAREGPDREAAVGRPRVKPLAVIEAAVKKPVFGCQMCGQCVLHSTGMTCPMNCPKMLRNGPCGGVRPDGHCEVKPEMRCVWVKAVERAPKTPWAHEIADIRKPVDNRLWNTSSWANLLTKRDKVAPKGWRVEA